VADDPAHPPAERTDHSPWNLLLLLAVVVPLLTFVYDGAEPRLFGFPLFYWLQLSYVGLTVVATVIVYRMTRRKPGLPTATAQKKERQP